MSSSKTPSKPPSSKLPRQPSVILTPPTPTSTPTKASKGPKTPSIKLPTSSTKKPTISSPRSNPTPTPPVNSSQTQAQITPASKTKSAPSSLKRPTPAIKSPPSTPATPTVKTSLLFEDDPSKQYKDAALVDVSIVLKIFRFVERQLLSPETTNEQDKAVYDKFLDAFTDVNNSSVPSSWPNILNHLKRKISEPRELYSKQLRTMQDQVNSQVFVMNERLVSEQESKEQLIQEVSQLRKQVQVLEEEKQGYGMLRRSLHINLQAALDHLQVSTRLLVEGRPDPDDEYAAYGKPDTPREEVNKHEGQWPKPTQPTSVEKVNDFFEAENGGSTSASEGVQEGGGEGQDGSGNAELDIERETSPTEEEAWLGRGGFDAEASEQLAHPLGPSSEIAGEDEGFEFFV